MADSPVRRTSRTNRCRCTYAITMASRGRAAVARHAVDAAMGNAIHWGTTRFYHFPVRHLMLSLRSCDTPAVACGAIDCIGQWRGPACHGHTMTEGKKIVLSGANLSYLQE